MQDKEIHVNTKTITFDNTAQSDIKQCITKHIIIQNNTKYN